MGSPVKPLMGSPVKPLMGSPVKPLIGTPVLPLIGMNGGTDAALVERLCTKSSPFFCISTSMWTDPLCWFAGEVPGTPPRSPPGPTEKLSVTDDLWVQAPVSDDLTPQK